MLSSGLRWYQSCVRGREAACLSLATPIRMQEYVPGLHERLFRIPVGTLHAEAHCEI